jgi:hypothetical protein
MECREARKLMLLFLGGKLDSVDLEAFIDHVVACKSCETYLLTMPGATEG